MSVSQELVRSLLYEGYALYPYTPGVKNATPTPFGIAYPPAYADAQPAAFSMLRLEAVLRGGPETELASTVLFLQAVGEEHEATERAIEVGPATLAELAREPRRVPFEFDIEDGPASEGGWRCGPSWTRPTWPASGSASTTRPRSGRPLARDARRRAPPQPDLHPPRRRDGGRNVRLAP